MGSITLPRMRSVRPEEKERAVTMDTARAAKFFSPHAQSPVGRGADERLQTALPVFIVPLLLPLASAATRHWLIEAGATLCVAGGFIAAPFLTLAAWIGLALPQRMVLHQASTALFVIAILWMAAALIGAHLHHNRRRAQPAACSSDGE